MKISVQATKSLLPVLISDEPLSAEHGVSVSQVPRLLLRVEEAAEALAIGRTALYGLLLAGEIPTIHIGRSVRISLSALEAYVRRRAALAENV